MPGFDRASGPAVMLSSAVLAASYRRSEPPGSSPAEERGHEVRVLDVLRCYMNITSHRPSMHYRGENLEPLDAVIPRIGASVTFYGTAVLRQFEMMGVYPLNESSR